MAFTDFYMNTASGSNLNSGSTSADAGGGSYTPVYTSVSGNWDGTSVFTPTDGATTSATVSVGMWVSIYPAAASATPYVGQVTAVGSGANGTITVSTTAKFGTAPTSSTGGTDARVGGSWADLGMTIFGTALNNTTAAQSTRVNIKAGTYAGTTTNHTLGVSGSTTAPVWWRGYQTTPGDQDANNNATPGTNIPLVTQTTGQLIVTGAHTWISNIAVTSQYVAAGSAAFSISGNTVTLYRCRVTNTAAAANGIAIQASNNSTFIACYFSATSSATACVTVVGTPAILDGCYFSGGIIGVKNTVEALSINDCIFDDQAGDAIQATTGQMQITGCSIWSPTGNGIVWSSTPVAICLVANCYFSTVNQSGKAAINNASGTNTNLIRCLSNAYFNCTSNTSGLGDSPLIFDNGTLASEAFSNPDTSFALKSTYYGMAFPGASTGFETITAYTGNLSFGAVQPAGGSGGVIASTWYGGFRG